MGVKHGRIVGIEPGGAVDRAKLDSGERVYVPARIGASIRARYLPTDELYFIERGLLGRTEWVGTLNELRDALRRGEVTSRDLGRFQLPPLAPAVAGWASLRQSDHHERTGSKLVELRDAYRRRGYAQFAEALTEAAWLENARTEGACLAGRPDAAHGKVWCDADRGHSGLHDPVCPACNLATDAVLLAARTTGDGR
jgi:hypothetical protein